MAKAWNGLSGLAQSSAKLSALSYGVYGWLEEIKLTLRNPWWRVSEVGSWEGPTTATHWQYEFPRRSTTTTLTTHDSTTALTYYSLINFK